MDEEIRQALDNLCSVLPKTVRAECQLFVDTYTDQVIRMLINELTPDQICIELHLCKPDTPQLQELSGANQLPLSRMFVGIPPQPQEVVDFVCAHLPSTLMNDCIDFVDLYGDSVIDILVDQELDPKLTGQGASGERRWRGRELTQQAPAQFYQGLLVFDRQSGEAQGGQGVVVVSVGRVEDDPACPLLHILQLLLLSGGCRPHCGGDMLLTCQLVVHCDTKKVGRLNHLEYPPQLVLSKKSARQTQLLTVVLNHSSNSQYTASTHEPERDLIC
ncbi:Prosaposin [Portunus trituberculatus]|uniref:Prosaposin n=1 Tax=Portunus trituberculatus TaxID=210409 RepID=A0A5B7FIQ0_PORTR|nr:Prosaposin [Portunus trituberculatus]